MTNEYELNKSMYGLLAVGACGGNQVNEFKKYQLPSFYLNSNLKDLLSLGDGINYYSIPEAYGCHGDRLVSQDYLSVHCDEIMDQVKQYLKTEYIIVFGSVDGGTSSGMLALLAELIEQDLKKKAIIFATVPDLKNASCLQAKRNTYDCIKELFDSAQRSVFLIDNSKEPNYDKSNAILASTLYNYLFDVSISKDGIFDQSEINAVLDKPGYAVLTSYNRKSGHSDITDFIDKALKGGNHIPMEQKNSQYSIGLKMSCMRKTATIDRERIKTQYGTNESFFVGYQTRTDSICMSGLKKPVTYLKELDAQIQSEELTIKAELEEAQKENEIKERVSVLDNLENCNKSEPPKKLSARERLKQMRMNKEKVS